MARTTPVVCKPPFPAMRRAMGIMTRDVTGNNELQPYRTGAVDKVRKYVTPCNDQHIQGQCGGKAERYIDRVSDPEDIHQISADQHDHHHDCEQDEHLVVVAARSSGSK